MSYGLYDADLAHYPTPFFNLELMKLSSYYKRKREIVSLSPTFSPQMYKNFIVRQDFFYPESEIQYFNNVTYGGRAFDGLKYKPLPEEIELMRPDIYLYNKIDFNPRKLSEQTSFNIMRKAEHVRLSLDSKTIWKNFEKQFRRDSTAYGIIFHDYDLNLIDGAYEFIRDNLDTFVAHKEGRRLGMKYPVQVSTEEDLLRWLILPSINSYYSLTYNNIVSNDLIFKLEDLKEISTSWRQIYNNVTSNITYEELINGGLQRILRAAVNLRNKRLNFPLIYDENVFIDKDWRRVMKMIDLYNIHLRDGLKRYGRFKYYVKFETLYSYMRNKVKQNRGEANFFMKENVERVFQFVREHDYELFKDFYEYRGEEVL